MFNKLTGISSVDGILLFSILSKGLWRLAKRTPAHGPLLLLFGCRNNAEMGSRATAGAVAKMYVPVGMNFENGGCFIFVLSCL